jgi:hypothetical protein
MASKPSKSKPSSKNEKLDARTRQQRTMQIVIVVVTIILILSYVLSLVANV